ASRRGLGFVAGLVRRLVRRLSLGSWRQNRRIGGGDDGDDRTFFHAPVEDGGRDPGFLCRIEGPPDSNRKSTDRSFQSLIPQCHQRPIPILGRQRGEVFDRPCRFPVVGDVIRRQLGEVGHQIGRASCREGV